MSGFRRALLKRWWELSFVRSFLPVFLLASFVFGLDSPVPFVKKSVTGSSGLPGWYSSPARVGEPAFGFSYWNVPEVYDRWAMSAAGEWGSRLYRVAFFYSYSEMDSLFREHYGELDGAYGLGPAVFGAAYGTLLDLVSREVGWVRHRIKAGAGLRWGNVYGSLWTMGFTDETWTGMGSLLWKPTEVFSLSVESDGKSLGVGHDFYFRFGSLSSFYSFPQFSVGVELVLNLKFLEWGGTHGFGNGNLGWNGLWLRKKFYFQKYDGDSQNRKY